MYTNTTVCKTVKFATSLLLVAFSLSLVACSSLLPKESKSSQTKWTSYEDAEAEFASIKPGETTIKQLKVMGIDPATTPNIALLSHADLLRRLHAMAVFGESALDPAIKGCVAARQKCYAYHLEQTLTKRDRVGNFWLDMLNFKKVTDVTGWQFDAIIIISNDVVVYKTWSGKQNIHEVEDERHPLGPFQGIGSAFVRR